MKWTPIYCLLITVFIPSVTRAEKTRSPRKVAIVAMGFKDEDNNVFKKTTFELAGAIGQILQQHKYEVATFVRRPVKQDGEIPVGNQLLEQLSSLESQIASSKLGPGDQVILLLRGHGGQRKSGKVGHTINFGNEDRPDMLEIQSRIQRLNKAGVKVAVIDGSCFPGNSIDFAKAGACVITGQNRFTESKSATLLSGAFFDHDFIHELKRELSAGGQKDLEELYLKVRKRLSSIGIYPHRESLGFFDFLASISYSNDLPEISSAEHDHLRPLWDSLFFSYRPSYWNQDYSPLGCALGEEAKEPRIAVEIAAKAAFGDDPWSYERWAYLNRQRTDLIQELGRIDQKLQDHEAGVLHEALLSRRNSLTDQLEHSEDEYRRLLGKVMLVERQLYDELYRSLKSQLKSGNACRDFVL